VKKHPPPEILALAQQLDTLVVEDRSALKYLKCKISGLALETVTQQWVVTQKPNQFVCTAATKLLETSTAVPALWPKVPNGHENVAVGPLAKKTPGASAVVALVGRIVSDWPPPGRDSVWKSSNGERHLLFFDFALNDGTGELAMSVQGEQWRKKLNAVKAKKGDMLFVYDMRAKFETDSEGKPSFSLSTVKDREPVILKIQASDTKRKLAAGDGPRLSKVGLERCGHSACGR
jgi:hypothetical protein